MYYVHDIFVIKYCQTDISGFTGGNPDLYLHCFKISYVHVQVSKYKNELIVLGCNDAEAIFLVA